MVVIAFQYGETLTEQEMDNRINKLKSKTQKENYEASCLVIDEDRVIEVKATVTPTFEPVKVTPVFGWEASNCITVKFSETIGVVLLFKNASTKVYKTYKETFCFKSFPDRLDLCNGLREACCKVDLNKHSEIDVELNELFPPDTFQSVRETCLLFQEELVRRLEHLRHLPERSSSSRTRAGSRASVHRSSLHRREVSRPPTQSSLSSSSSMTSPRRRKSTHSTQEDVESNISVANGKKRNRSSSASSTSSDFPASKAPRRATKNKRLKPQLQQQEISAPSCRPFFENEKACVGLVSGLKQCIKGQDTAVEIIARRISSRLHHSTNNVTRPLVLCFGGPTGTGKTEMAKHIVTSLFDVERTDEIGMSKVFKRFNLSEYTTSESAKRMTGGDPNYVGYDEGGELINFLQVADQYKRARLPNGPIHTTSVVLFDEIEKADKTIMTFLMNFFDVGQLTSTKGVTVDARRTVIILTTNAGSASLSTFKHEPYTKRRMILENALLEEVFAGRAELLRRMSECVPFQVLDNTAAEKMIAQQLERVIPSSFKARYKIVFGLHVKKTILDRFMLMSDGRSTERLIETIYGDCMTKACWKIPPNCMEIDIDFQIKSFKSDKKSYEVVYTEHNGTRTTNEFPVSIPWSEIEAREQLLQVVEQVKRSIRNSDITALRSLFETQNQDTIKRILEVAGEERSLLLYTLDLQAVEVLEYLLNKQRILPWAVKDFYFRRRASDAYMDTILHECCRVNTKHDLRSALILQLVMNWWTTKPNLIKQDEKKDLLNATDESGFSALHYCVKNDLVECAHVLLDNLANRHLKAPSSKCAPVYGLTKVLKISHEMLELFIDDTFFHITKPSLQIILTMCHIPIRNIQYGSLGFYNNGLTRTITWVPTG